MTHAEHEHKRARQALDRLIQTEIAKARIAGYSPVTLAGLLELTRDGTDAIGSGTATAVLERLDWGEYRQHRGTLIGRMCRNGADVGGLGTIPLFCGDDAAQVRVMVGDRLQIGADRWVVTVS